jgi:hypothetical protein
MSKEELKNWLEEYRINLLSLMGEDDYTTGKLDVIRQVLDKLKPINDDTDFYGTFDASGYEAELSECTGIDIESIENLKGARIQILCDAKGDDEYFDIVFMNYYDEEEQPLVINALSKEHITFEAEH